MDKGRVQLRLLRTSDPVAPIGFDLQSLCGNQLFDDHMIMPIKLNWKFEDGSYVLYRQGSRAPVLCVVPDKTYPAMWRIKTKAGVLSDMVNLSRAKDAAFGLAMDKYDRQTRVERPQEGRTAIILPRRETEPVT